MPKTTLAQRIQQTRELRKMTQAELAKAAGVRQSTIGNLEAGIRRSTERLLEIAGALRVRPEWLQDGIGQRDCTPSALRPEVLELAQRINDMPADKLAAIRLMVDALGPAAPEERVAQFYKPTK